MGACVWRPQLSIDFFSHTHYPVGETPPSHVMTACADQIWKGNIQWGRVWENLIPSLWEWLKAETMAQSQTAATNLSSVTPNEVTLTAVECPSTEGGGYESRSPWQRMDACLHGCCFIRKLQSAVTAAAHRRWQHLKHVTEGTATFQPLLCIWLNNRIRQCSL